MPKNYSKFINKKIKEIREIIGKERAIRVLSRGGDGSTVIVLGYRAIENQLKTLSLTMA